MVLQALEGLSDREAVSALRRDIAWKLACGLWLDDEGFHPTALVYWRNRLRASRKPRRVFDAVGEVVAAIRRVRRLVPQAREVELQAHDDDRAGKPVCAWDDPRAIQALVSGLVNDALAADGGTIDRLAGRRRLPRVSYRGIGRNGLWWSPRVAAVNLRRLSRLPI
jgi:hypothetical protein